MTAVAACYLMRAVVSLCAGALFLIDRRTVTPIALFAAWAFADGILAIGVAAVARGPWQLAFVGASGLIVCGFLSMFVPVGAAVFYAWVALWALCKGTGEILLGMQLRREGETWVVVDGMLSLVLAGLMLALPVGGLLRLEWLLAVYGLTIGATQLGAGALLYGYRPSFTSSAGTRSPT